MVTVGYNPSTLKALWGTGGKLCIGCCNQALECSYSDCGVNTPYQVSITYNLTNHSCVNGSDTWFDCQIYGNVAVYTDMDIANYLSGPQTLSQVNNCAWQKIVTISDESVWSQCYDGPEQDPPDCSGCCASGWTEHPVTSIKLDWMRFSTYIVSRINLLTTTHGWLPICDGINTNVSGHCAKINSGDPIVLSVISSGAGLATGTCYGE